MGVLDGKVAIITGAGSGLGRAHARLFAAEGAKVVVNDLGPAADETVALITAAGGTAVANRSNVAEWGTGTALVAQAVDVFGDCDIIVNNAGILRDRMSFSMTEEEFDLVVAVHLKGHFALSRAAAVYWREESKAGREKPRRLIHTTSEAGLYGGAGQSNYAAAKAGIATLATLLARELEKYQVTSNAIAPRARTGLTEHQSWSKAPEDPAAFDRFDPANVSPVVLWLASDAAQHVNGQVVLVAGGTILLLERWPIIGRLDKDGRWTYDEIVANAPRLFGEHDPGIPPFRTQRI
jgi:NAD(P)-dependent dehydrogenase (short-subunit alcohol dehydrogenase family)